MTPREDMQRQLHNLITTAIQTLYAVNNQANVTLDDKLRAVTAVERAFPDIRRALIYLMNTEPKRLGGP